MDVVGELFGLVIDGVVDLIHARYGCLPAVGAFVLLLAILVGLVGVVAYWSA